jgi:hypothetical protein
VVIRSAGLWHAADGGGGAHSAARTLLEEDCGHIRCRHAALLQKTGVSCERVVMMAVLIMCDELPRYVLDGPYMSKELGGCLDEDVW